MVLIDEKVDEESMRREREMKKSIGEDKVRKRKRKEE